MDSELSTPEFEDYSSSRRHKRLRKSFAESSIALIDIESSQSNYAPKDLTFIADSVNGKGKKPPLSCCECRRLKLKCDRTFPCTSCKKRGCAEICPDGVLVSGKGTRFILANTEQLHSKIQEMSERIRSLEDALQACYAERVFGGIEVHPLLQPEYLGIKSTMGLYSCAQPRSTDFLGMPGGSHSRKSSLAASDNGVNEEYSTFPHQSSSPQEFGADRSDADLSGDIIYLSRNFPLADSEPNPQLREHVRSNLPRREVADYLWEQTQQNALWQCNPHPDSSFYPSLAHHCYSSPIHELSPRRLALLLMILAVGCLVDLRRPTNHPDSEKYHRLARASLCEIPVMEATNVETITALFYEIWYLLVFSDKQKAAGHAWGLMGLTAKLAQSIDLHRTGGKMKIAPEEAERRRALFWELLYLDARLSLALGRPASLSINHVDCPRPSYTIDDNCNPSRSFLFYQEWKHSCYLHCLAPVIDAISQPSLSYDAVLDLDRRIRDFSIPNPLKDKNDDSRFIVLQRVSLSTALEAILLQLHRQFFTRALSTPEEGFSRRHRYAPSVVAVFLSASRLIASLQDFYNHEPHLAGRILGFWSNALSAAVALCLLVSRAPFACLSPAALQELERARILFRSAKDTCPRAMQVIPVLEAMIKKANEIYLRWLNHRELPAVEFRYSDDLEVPVKRETCSVLNGQVADFDQYVEPVSLPAVPPQPVQHQTLQDPFIRAHPSLAQCIREVHERPKASLPSQNHCNCNCSSAATGHNHPFWCSWSPRPHVASPVLTEVLPAVNFPKEHSTANGYSSLRAMGCPNGSIPALQRYLPVGSSQAVYGEQNTFSESVYVGTLLPPDQITRQTRSHSTVSSRSKMSVVDTLSFELGALGASSDQNWMAFF